MILDNIREGQLVWYHHRTRSKPFRTGDYSARALVLRVGKRVTILNLEIETMLIVEPGNLERPSLAEADHFLNPGGQFHRITSEDINALEQRYILNKGGERLSKRALRRWHREGEIDA